MFSGADRNPDDRETAFGRLLNNCAAHKK